MILYGICRSFLRKRFPVCRPHVLAQLMRPEKAFVAQLAIVAVITSMNPHVVIQIITACISLVALFTLKWFIFGVCEQVSLELVVAVERLHASSVTAEWAGKSRSGIRVVD